MKKIAVFISVLFVFTTIVSPVSAQEEVSLKSDNVIFISLNENRVLYEKGKDEKIYPASMTKIMTALVALENIDDLNKTHTITYKDLEGLQAAGASVAGFKVNQVVTYKDLLYGILLPSGADATQAIANALFGSEEKFVEAMNKKCKELKLKNTHFANTSGLHEDDHYSTVADIAKLLRYALKNETFKDMFCTYHYVTSDNQIEMYSTMQVYLMNQNMDASFILGSKTGFTYEAGLCLASYGKYKDDTYIMVSAQTHSDNSYPYHVADAISLYDYIYGRYKREVLLKKGDMLPDSLAKILVKFGNPDTLTIHAGKEDISYLKDTQKDGKIRYEFELADKFKEDGYVVAPLEKGELLGKLRIYEDDTLVYEKNNYLHEDLEAHYFIYYVLHPFTFISDFKWILLAIIGIVGYVIYRKKKNKNTIYRMRRMKYHHR